MHLLQGKLKFRPDANPHISPLDFLGQAMAEFGSASGDQSLLSRVINGKWISITAIVRLLCIVLKYSIL